MHNVFIVLMYYSKQEYFLGLQFDTTKFSVLDSAIQLESPGILTETGGIFKWKTSSTGFIYFR